MKKKRTESNITLIVQFAKFLRPYWKKGLFAFIFMIITICLQLPVPFLSKYIIDKVIELKNFKLLNIIGFSIIGIILLRAFSSFLESFLLTIFRSRVIYDIRLKLYEHIQILSLRYFQNQQTGYLMSRIGDDVQSLHGLLADTILSSIQNVLLFSAGIFSTFYIHSKLAVISLSILPIYGFLIWLFNKRIRKMSWEVREAYANIQRDLHELISGMFIIKAFHSGQWAITKLSKSLSIARQRDVKLSITNTLLMVISTIITSIGPLLVIWYGGAEVIRGNLTIGGLIAFNAFLRYLFGPTRTFININLSIQRSLASASRIFDILKKNPEVMEVRNPVKIRDLKGKVKYSDIFFAYDDKTVLESINFTANPGETLAVVGPSGAGKSTLISLIPRFFDPIRGCVSIDGMDVRKYELSSLREKIGIIPQDVFLFNTSIMENIKIALASSDISEIISASKKAHAHEFICRLPEKYETIVGERGVKLSGGERQRIAIARAILHNPKILIMDEATSQVDSESEKLIHESIITLMKNRTTFIIAHKLSTIVNVDKIIVLDRGKIIDIGKHAELYKNCPIYKKLYDIKLAL